MSEQPSSEFRKRIVRYAAVLTGVCVVSGGVLAALYDQTRHLIAANAAKTFQHELSMALGDATNPQKLGGDAGESPEEMIYVARTASGVRYVATGSAQGYQSRIVVLAAVDAEPEKPVEDNPLIYRVAVVSSAETPGLGERIKEVALDVSLWAVLAGRADTSKAAEARPWFQEQFSLRGKRLNDLVVVKSDKEGGIIAVTGATITSKAVTEAARQAVQHIIVRTRKLYK